MASWLRCAAAGRREAGLREVRWIRALGWGLAMLAGGSVSVYGQQATLVADAHVSSGEPAVNSGTISNLYVGSGYTALLQFDLSTLPAGTTAAQVSKAVVRLYCNRIDTAGLVSVEPVGSAWGEYSVTYATLPALGSATQVVQVSQAGAFVTVDVTALVQGWIGSPATNHGLALTAGTAGVQFDSKENDLTGHQAELEVWLSGQTFAGAAGPAGPAGPQGPAGATGQGGGCRGCGRTDGCGGPGRAGRGPWGGGVAGTGRAAGSRGAAGESGAGVRGCVPVDDELWVGGCGGVPGVELYLADRGKPWEYAAVQSGAVGSDRAGAGGTAGAGGSDGCDWSDRAAGADGAAGAYGVDGNDWSAGAAGTAGLDL